MNLGDTKTEGKWATKYIWVECPKCKQQRWMRLSNYKRGHGTGLCLACFNGRRHGAPLLHDGYVLVSQPNHARAVYGGFVKRAVLVMESILGRPLTKSEHIHHINGVRDDDRADNLIVLTNSEHSRLHMTQKSNIKNKYKMALSQR